MGVLLKWKIWNNWKRGKRNLQLKNLRERKRVWKREVRTTDKNWKWIKEKSRVNYEVIIRVLKTISRFKECWNKW